MLIGDKEYQCFLVPTDKLKERMFIIDRDIPFMQLMLEMFALTTRVSPFELQIHFEDEMLLWTPGDKEWSWQ